MSDVYAIKETTLTALGDAIRNKVIGISKTPAPINKDNVSIGPYSFEVIEFPSGVQTVKVIGHINEYESSISENTVLYTLGYASGVYTRERDIRSATDFTIINPNWDGVGYDFEITVKGNAISFTTGQGYSSWGATSTYDYTAVGLDENGNEFKYTPLEMVGAINDLIVVPNTALYITGSCASQFANNQWNWFVECGDKIITNDITDISSMFHSSNQLTNIPFDINMKISYSAPAQRAFYNCLELRNIPMISNLKITSSGASHMFFGCSNIRYFPEGFADDWDFSSMKSVSYAGMNNLFNGCFSLRKVPLSLIGNFCSRGTSTSNCSYYGSFSDCLSLDEINGLDVSQATLSSNCFSNVFGSVRRLKDMTFAINEDGTSKTANWQNQTIDLSGAGYLTSASSKTFILNYNSGITADKEVIDDATYQALKDDPDWFSTDVNYSRYNHTSAVNTINSLPDCSATGTNTIKFKGASGALTDGGAINTLTEEEIAVATAKGWTVTLS